MMMMMTMRVSNFVLLALLFTMGSNGLEQQGKCDAGVSAAACAARPEEDDKGTASLPGDDDELDSEEEMQLLQAQKKMQSETKSGRQSELSARTTKKARTGASRQSEENPFEKLEKILWDMCKSLEKDWAENRVTCAEKRIWRPEIRAACKEEETCATCEEEETECTEGGKIWHDAKATCEEEETACKDKKAACENEKDACKEETEKIKKDIVETCLHEEVTQIQACIEGHNMYAEGTCEEEETACNEGGEVCADKMAACLDKEVDAARQGKETACNKKAACENKKAACENNFENKKTACIQKVDALVDAACGKEETAYNQKVASCGELNKARAVLERAGMR